MRAPARWWDRVEITALGDGTGSVDRILERKNAFSRPAVANMDQLVMIAAELTRSLIPSWIDRVAAIAERKGCEPVICLNKCDLEPCEQLYGIYHQAGFTTIQVSAVTGEGIQQLSDAIAGKNGGLYGQFRVGKSSILNALDPRLAIATGEVSEKLGRGRHTTRHVELFRLPNGGSGCGHTGLCQLLIPRCRNCSTRKNWPWPSGSSTLSGSVQICGLFPH